MPEFQDLMDRLQSLKGDEIRKAERKALRAVGSMVRDALIEAAPVQGGTSYGPLQQGEQRPHGLLQPGELKDSIKARLHIASDASTVDGDVSRVTIGPTGAAAEVARWLEHGHLARASKTHDGPVRFVPAHPFIRPVQDATESAAAQLYTTTMSAEIDRIMEGK